MTDSDEAYCRGEVIREFCESIGVLKISCRDSYVFNLSNIDNSKFLLFSKIYKVFLYVALLYFMSFCSSLVGI